MEIILLGMFNVGSTADVGETAIVLISLSVFSVPSDCLIAYIRAGFLAPTYKVSEVFVTPYKLMDCLSPGIHMDEKVLTAVNVPSAPTVNVCNVPAVVIAMTSDPAPPIHLYLLVACV